MLTFTFKYLHEQKLIKLRILKKPESGVKQLNNSITIYQPICHPQVGVFLLNIKSDLH